MKRDQRTNMGMDVSSLKEAGWEYECLYSGNRGTWRCPIKKTKHTTEAALFIQKRRTEYQQYEENFNGH